MRVLSLLLLCACGLTRIESVRGDAAADSNITVDGSAADVLSADAPSADAPSADVPALDALIGSCTPTVSACPNISTMVEMGTPSNLSGALVQGHANDVASTCGGGGTSEWTIAVSAEEAGRLEYRFSSAARYGIEIRDGCCTGTPVSCSVTDNSTYTTSIAAGQTYLIVVEAVTACDVPFDLTLSLLPN